MWIILGDAEEEYIGNSHIGKSKGMEVGENNHEF